MTLYELNQQAYKKAPYLTPEEIAEKKKLLTDFFNRDSAFMLLCKEISYYTVFLDRTAEQLLPPKFCDEVIDCVQNLGSIKSIELDGHIEIWVEIEDEMHAMLLFPYSEGVIECRA